MTTKKIYAVQTVNNRRMHIKDELLARPLFLWLIVILLLSGINSVINFKIGQYNLSGYVWVFILVITGLLLLSVKTGIPPIFKFYLPFIIWGCAGFFIVDIGLKNVQDFIQLIVPFIIGMFAFKVIKSTSDIDKVLVAAIIVLFLLYLKMFLSFDGTDTFKIVGREASMISTWCMSIIMFYGLKNWKIGLLAPAAILLAIIPGSRAGTFILIGLLMFYPTRTNYLKYRLIFIFIAGTVALYAFNTSFMQERFFIHQGMKGDFEDVRNLSFDTAGRSLVWPAIWERSWENPIMGHGPGSVHKACIDEVGVLEHPHNDYLKIFFEYGIVGSILLWGFFIYSLIFCWKIYKRTVHVEIKIVAGAASTSIIGFLLFSITDNPVIYTLLLITPVFILIASAARLDSLSRRHLTKRTDRTTDFTNISTGDDYEKS